MGIHEELLAAAREAIERLFSDLSVSEEHTARSLEMIKDEIEEKLIGLPDPGIE